ncbi:DUF6776 family protein [uncultured Thiohalocapsa sp.]|uniref:DUF6776 family protein n=1 Tax=uncultured Thiohalocapsa sp. TaxID=768990 RepID=UPI0025E6E066|nr:DUF6776 family protein [uncultured Thiohalocapsa sp.]
MTTTATEAPAAEGGDSTRWLLISVGWLSLLATAFALGYLLAQHDALQAMARIQALQTERDMQSELLAAQREKRAKLERSHLMDVTAQRAAQAQIVVLERERMRLQQQLTQLRALIGSSGRGLVEVDGLVLRDRGGGRYHYRLTLGQLVPDFGLSEGEVVLSVVTVLAGERVMTPLADLATDDGAGHHTVAFEHFQVIEGSFRLADAASPVELMIEIVPKDDTLMASQEVVLWETVLAGESAAVARMPVGKRQQAWMSVPADGPATATTRRPTVRDNDLSPPLPTMQ